MLFRRKVTLQNVHVQVLETFSGQENFSCQPTRPFTFLRSDVTKGRAWLKQDVRDNLLFHNGKRKRITDQSTYSAPDPVRPANECYSKFFTPPSAKFAINGAKNISKRYDEDKVIETKGGDTGGTYTWKCLVEDPSYKPCASKSVKGNDSISLYTCSTGTRTRIYDRKTKYSPIRNGRRCGKMNSGDDGLQGSSCRSTLGWNGDTVRWTTNALKYPE
ncbi:hypothetical protein J6590_076474 [Homalodisca vitripennis]|nr:hypothetical protein J6590_076474 [Homalodisca vitripennis]